MFNRIILMGRLTRDPELRTTQSGIQMCRFSVAVDRAYSKGEEKQTDFIDITAWRQTAEFVSKWFTKGRMILVEGKLQNNNYTDQNGVKHYQNVVIADSVSFCGDKSGNQQSGWQTQQNQQYQQGYGQPQQQYQNPQGYQKAVQGYGQPQSYQQYQQPAQGYQQGTTPTFAPQGALGGASPAGAPRQPPPAQYHELDDFETILAGDAVPF